MDSAYLFYCSASVELFLPGVYLLGLLSASVRAVLPEICLLALLFSLCSSYSCLEFVCLSYCSLFSHFRAVSTWDLTICNTVQLLFGLFLIDIRLLALLFAVRSLSALFLPGICLLSYCSAFVLGCFLPDICLLALLFTVQPLS